MSKLAMGLWLLPIEIHLCQCKLLGNWHKYMWAPKLVIRLYMLQFGTNLINEWNYKLVNFQQIGVK
jgi:hypothetical protein